MLCGEKSKNFVILLNHNIPLLYFSPPLLIVCNKQDSGMAKSSGAVQALLEKEIEKVKIFNKY